MKLKLRELREAAHLNQSDIARIAGVDLKTAGSWDRGKTYPKADAIWLLCEALNTDPNTMLGWYDEHPEDRPSASVTRDEAALVDNYRACSHDRRMMVSGYARDQCELSRQQEAPYTSPSLGNESLAETAARLGGAARVAKGSRMEFEDRAV